MSGRPLEEVKIEWSGGQRFTGLRHGFETQIDGEQGVGPNPVALLVESVAACAAIDVVLILEKGRQEIRSLSVVAHAARQEDVPRYVRRLSFEFELRGDIDEAKARRAVMLSFEKYCSVFHSLRKDIELEWSVTIDP